MISSLASSEASSISSAATSDGSSTVHAGPIANFTYYMSKLSHSSTLNTQFDWSEESLNMMAQYYNLIFALKPEDKLQLIDFMGNCYLHEFTDTSTKTTSTSTTFYKTLFGSASTTDRVPTSITQMLTTEVVTGHVASAQSDQFSAYQNYKFGDGSLFWRFFQFGANLNLISWSIVDNDGSTSPATAVCSVGNVPTPTSVVETTVSVNPSGNGIKCDSRVWVWWFKFKYSRC
ncbi:unnamed protein product [Ambrosiozyma monospora]|uniref:Unnamed protein product n=1 Tax=Ambrosiozyma monospora TaxID=43982 RepID=A0ACB5T370_AMBMO|nr:unnamed protein product [Ambrosiozyma monospora]